MIPQSIAPPRTSTATSAGVRVDEYAARVQGQRRLRGAAVEHLTLVGLVRAQVRRPEEFAAVGGDGQQMQLSALALLARRDVDAVAGRQRAAHHVPVLQFGDALRAPTRLAVGGVPATESKILSVLTDLSDVARDAPQHAIVQGQRILLGKVILVLLHLLRQLVQFRAAPNELTRLEIDGHQVAHDVEIHALVVHGRGGRHLAHRKLRTPTPVLTGLRQHSRLLSVEQAELPAQGVAFRKREIALAGRRTVGRRPVCIFCTPSREFVQSLDGRLLFTAEHDAFARMPLSDLPVRFFEFAPTLGPSERDRRLHEQPDARDRSLGTEIDYGLPALGRLVHFALLEIQIA